MTSSAAITKPQYRILILSGPDKGTAYELMSPQIRIGREQDNDIIITDDPHLSRHHAMVQITHDQIEVIDVSQKNKITVNNEKMERAYLQDGMTFKVGTTEMRLERLPSVSGAPFPAAPTAPAPLVNMAHTVTHLGPKMRPLPPRPVPLTGAPSLSAPPPQQNASMGLPPRPRPPRRRPQGGSNSGRLPFYMIIVVVAVVMYFAFNTGGSKRKEDVLRTSEQVESTIKESQVNKEKLRQKVEKQGNTYQDAQALYVQGFRDYKKGQYSRAIEALRGALSVHPDHVLAQRYLKLAYRRLDELIQFHMIRGRQFRSRAMYDKCVAAFNSVIILSPDKNSATFKEARELQEECTLQAQGRY